MAVKAWWSYFHFWRNNLLQSITIILIPSAQILEKLVLILPYYKLYRGRKRILKEIYKEVAAM